MMSPEVTISMRLDAEDLALLEACMAAEKLTKSDIVRKAIREYAARTGVAPQKPRKAKK